MKFTCISLRVCAFSFSKMSTKCQNADHPSNAIRTTAYKLNRNTKLNQQSYTSLFSCSCMSFFFSSFYFWLCVLLLLLLQSYSCPHLFLLLLFLHLINTVLCFFSSFFPSFICSLFVLYVARLLPLCSRHLYVPFVYHYYYYYGWLWLPVPLVVPLAGWFIAL